MNIDEQIKTEIDTLYQEFIKNLEMNSCGNCNKLPEGKFCSRECYYNTIFNYKGAYSNVAPELYAKYFGINKSKHDEFISICNEMIETYY